MRLNKTEQKLLDRLNDTNYNSVSTYGVRENNAARKLEEKGLVVFTNHSEYVSPRHGIRRRNGDYVGYFVTQGSIRKV